MKAQSLTQLHNKIFKSITAKVGFENEELGMLHSSRDNTQGLLPQLNVDFFYVLRLSSLYLVTLRHLTLLRKAWKRGFSPDSDPAPNMML